MNRMLCFGIPSRIGKCAQRILRRPPETTGKSAPKSGGSRWSEPQLHPDCTTIATDLRAKAGSDVFNKAFWESPAPAKEKVFEWMNKNRLPLASATVVMAFILERKLRNKSVPRKLEKVIRDFIREHCSDVKSLMLLLELLDGYFPIGEDEEPQKTFHTQAEEVNRGVSGKTQRESFHASPESDGEEEEEPHNPITSPNRYQYNIKVSIDAPEPIDRIEITWDEAKGFAQNQTRAPPVVTSPESDEEDTEFGFCVFHDRGGQKETSTTLPHNTATIHESGQSNSTQDAAVKHIPKLLQVAPESDDGGMEGATGLNKNKVWEKAEGRDKKAAHPPKAFVSEQTGINSLKIQLVQKTESEETMPTNYQPTTLPSAGEGEDKVKEPFTGEVFSPGGTARFARHKEPPTLLRFVRNFQTTTRESDVEEDG